jgi:hypothetical protein
MEKGIGSLMKAILAATAAVGVMMTGCVPKEEELESDPHIGDIRLTEIQYHPDDYDSISDDSLEFIELKNVGSAAVNLGALECTDGIEYRFPGDAEIPAGGFYVIASNKDCFAKRYDFDPDGVYSGQLSNSGEKIEITDRASNDVIISQTYSDGGNWPKEADGGGYSLVPMNPNPGNDETDPEYWRGSSSIGGSPGEDDEKKKLDPALLNLRITEIQYHPDYPDSLGRDSLEFIEFKNVGSEACTLTGVTFSSGIQYTFPAGAVLKPDSFCVLASNSKWFKTRYGFKPFDEYKGQLRNSKDTLTIKEIKSGDTLFSLAYSDGANGDAPWSTFSKFADAGGWTLVTKNPNPSALEQTDPEAWWHSLRLNGSPGRDDPKPILVNEALTHTDPPLTDAVELYNPNDQAIDLGNWFISDDINHPTKYRIPVGTTIPAGGYLVFDEHDFYADPASPNAFRFSEYGEAVYLFADSIGEKGFYHGFEFGPIENAVSFGRYKTSIGREDFVAQTAVSLGAENKGPRVGPVVITEIMYHPSDSLGEFIEVKNVSNGDVSLFDKSDTAITWRIPSVGFSFPANTSLKAGEVALILGDGISLDSLKNRYSIPDSVRLFTMNGTLDNTTDTVVLAKPDVDSIALTMPELPYITVDRVVYENKGDWPSEADGTGKSLNRIDPKDYANDPASWKAEDPTAGR